MAYTSRNYKSQDSGIKSLSANDKINSPKEAPHHCQGKAKLLYSSKRMEERGLIGKNS